MFTLEEVINGKNSFYSEIMDAADRRLKISLKIWLRLKAFDKVDQVGPGGATPATSYGGISGI